MGRIGAVVGDMFHVGSEAREEVGEGFSGISETDMVASMKMRLDQLRKLGVDDVGGRLEIKVEKIDIDEKRVGFASLQVYLAAMKELRKVVHVGWLSDYACPDPGRTKGDPVPVSRDLKKGFRFEGIKMDSPLHNVA